ncbi:MAG TPA: hypothetical protein VG961_05130 [Ignavibacteria bacterium]|nr:hypothetical protein [Ignavibacteria bacterium]
MTGKLVLIWFILLFCAALLPADLFEENKSFENPGTVVITFNECGCECPDASIVNGKLKIPEELIREHPEIRSDEISIINEDIKALEEPGENRKLVITCEVIDHKFIYCSAEDCLVVPVVNVTSWSFDSYVPLVFKSKLLILIFIFLLGLSTLMTVKLWFSRS